MEKDSTKALRRWFPILLLTILAGVAVATGIYAANTASRRNRLRDQSNRENSIGAEETTQTTEKEKVQDQNTPWGIEGILRNVDPEKETITVYQVARMEEVLLTYNGATEVLTRYGNRITMQQLTPGMIVRTECEKRSMKLLRIQEDTECWTYKGITSLEVDHIEYVMSFAGKKYQFDKNLTISDQGNLVSFEDLSDQDVLIARGIGNKVYSLEVSKGHGTLSFDHYDNLLGGTVEIGYEIFGTITANMEYTLREGSYKVILKKNDLSVNKYITIHRGENQVLDLNFYQEEIGRYGQVKFTLSPEKAELYLDNELVDISRPVELGYGEYVLEVRCEGYETCTRLLTVGSASMSIRIDLADSPSENSSDVLLPIETEENQESADDKEDDESEDIVEIIDDPEEETPDEDEEEFEPEVDDVPEEQVITGHKILIRKPEGAAVYFDSEYVGVAPVEIQKVSGEHQVRLTREGYISKTYTIEVENDNEDPIFSFPDLTKE